MFWRSKLVKNRSVRGSVRPVAATVAAAPLSSTPASDNSRASAAAVAELVKGLDFVFDQLDFENEPGDLLRLHLERLAMEAAKYENSRVADSIGDAWQCAPDMAQLLYAACQCSSFIYKPVKQSEHDLVPVMSRTPSMTGTEKAACIWKMASTNSLIVSVRGTASAADHMVNLNGTPKDASCVFNLGGGPPVQAHGGFLACAETLIPSLSEDILRHVSSDPSVDRIVFTGHSAGGAVSSLIFLHFLCQVSQMPSKFPPLTLALATFGSPPVTSVNVTDLAQSMPCSEFAIVFANEHDLVTRSDPSYISSIVDLYRSRYGLPSVATDHTTARVPDGNNDFPVMEKDGLIRSVWPLPKPTYHLLGDIVVLRTHHQSSALSLDFASDAHTLPVSLQPVRISPQDYAQLLFCEVSVHKRRLYLERMRMLLPNQGKASSVLSSVDTLLVPDGATYPD